MDYARAYNGNEISQVLCSIDDVLVGTTDENDYIMEKRPEDPVPTKKIGFVPEIVDFGYHNRGEHRLICGVYNSGKTNPRESTIVVFDEIVLTATETDARPTSSPVQGPTIVFDSTFVANADGFEYADDLFRGTRQPDYASGTFNSTIGRGSGGLHVLIGGVDPMNIENISVRRTNANSQ